MKPAWGSENKWRHQRWVPCMRPEKMQINFSSQTEGRIWRLVMRIREEDREATKDKEILRPLLCKNPSSIFYCLGILKSLYSYRLCVVWDIRKTHSGWMKHWHQLQHNKEQTWKSRGPEGKGIHEQSLTSLSPCLGILRSMREDLRS